MSILIHQLPAEDEAGFVQMLEIYQNSIERSEQKPAAKVRALLTDPRYLVLVARMDERVIGFSMSFLAPADGFWLLEYMAVSSTARSTGIGARLFHATASAAGWRMPNAVGLLEVDEPGAAVSATNDPAARLRFYSRVGCRRIGEFTYILPLDHNGPPPPMMLLFVGDATTMSLPRDRVRGWLSTVYRDVYGCSPDDPRIDTMLSHSSPSLQLRTV